jgi:hypothetical protein
MKKAKLIKKDSPMQEQLKQAKKVRKTKGKKPPQARATVEVTREWLQEKRQGAPSARKAFASLFGGSDPQSA